MTTLDLALLLATAGIASFVTYLTISTRALSTRKLMERVDADLKEENQGHVDWRSSALKRFAFAEKLVLPSQRSVMRRKLRRLGYDSNAALRVFAIIKLAAGVLLGLLGLAIGAASPAAAFMLMIALGALGVYLPDILVDRRLQAAEVDAELALAGAVDLIHICITAGMNLERAITRVSSELTGPIRQDLAAIADRISLGESVEESVKSLAAAEEISNSSASFLRSIGRATRLGVPLANIVEQSADEMRKKRIDLVKTSAGKLPVKILLPLMTLLLPAVLIVVLGPAVLGLIEGFSNL